MNIENISAVAFAVRDMARSVDFYEKCGFTVFYGGRDSEFTTMRADNAFVNLVDTPDHAPHWWGRVIFRVKNADKQFEKMTAAGIRAEFAPKDAAWGERYFHITDPDGHELSFAQLLEG